MMKKLCIKTTLALSLVALSQASNADLLDGSARVLMKNAYIDRDFAPASVKDTGSWSQGASLFLKSGMTDTTVQLGIDTSLQYAIRLSSDKGVADTILPYDPVDQTQAKDQLKYGATVKAQYKDINVKVGELWLEMPITHVDGSRQLVTSYQGANVNFKASPNLNMELGRVEKVSPRNEEKFHDLSYTVNGTRLYSEGLNYLDIKYKPSASWHLEYYFGDLESLFHRHYLGAEYVTQWNDIKSKTKFKYFHTIDSNDSLMSSFTNHNIGFLQGVEYKNHSAALGYQQIGGDQNYALLDGYLPEIYFINWNVTGFFKEKEKSWHAIYAYSFDGALTGLNAGAKYSYGYDFVFGNFKDNTESELSLGLNYKFQQPKFKDWSMSYLFVDYDNKHGNDFNEQRVFLAYQKSFS